MRAAEACGCSLTSSANQNASVQNVTVTGRFCVGMPTSEISATHSSNVVIVLVISDCARLMSAMSRIVKSSGSPARRRCRSRRSEVICLMADTQLFRKVMGKFTTGVTVVTVTQKNGGVKGMTASGLGSMPNRR